MKILYENIFKTKNRLKYILEKNKRIPLRIKLCLYAFAENLTLEQLKDLLFKFDCPNLYSRNIHDASIIHAFTRGLTFEEWLEADKNASIEFAVKVDGDSNEPSVTVNDGRGERLSFIKLQEYLHWFEEEAEKNKSMFGDVYTNRFTDFINSELLNFAEESVPFEDFVKNYKDKFVVNRQRSRRYVIDGLCSYLKHKIKQSDAEELFENKEYEHIKLLNVITDMDDFYQNVLLIKRKLWEELNGGDLKQISPNNRPVNQTHEAEAFTDYLSKVITGKIDISRNFLLVFLVFVKKTTQLVTMDDFNTILDQCGFYPLDDNDADMKTFDFFVLETIENDIKKDMHYLAKLYDLLLEDFYAERQGRGFVIEPRDEEITIDEKTDNTINS